MIKKLIKKNINNTMTKKEKTKILLSQYATASTVVEKEKIRNEIVVLNQNLVNFLIKKKNLPSWDLEDQSQAGKIGILKAVDNYILKKPPCTFSTFASFYIMTEVRENNRHCHHVYIPFTRWGIRKRIMQDNGYTQKQKKITQYMSNEDKKNLVIAASAPVSYLNEIAHIPVDPAVHDDFNNSISVNIILNKLFKEDKFNYKLIKYKFYDDASTADIRKKIFKNKIKDNTVRQKIAKILKKLSKNKELKQAWDEL